MRPKLLFADPEGRVLEHPHLLASLRQGAALLPPSGRPIPLPPHGKLVQLPGRVPVGVDPDSGQLVLLEQLQVGRRTIRPTAVGALLPPGYTRAFLPGEVQAEGPMLPQWAYTAAGWTPRGPVAWAVRTDRRSHWDPARYSTEELKGKVGRLRRLLPGNRIIEQLTTCALVYRCFTSQNIFYGRDEGALPVSTACNAQCVGCISEQPDDGAPASHDRIGAPPAAEEIAAVALHHLTRATGRVMVSFGQGCEGEPLTRWKVIASAVRAVRQRTPRGSININTNASLTRGLEEILDAGVDAVRVSLNSAVPDLYEAYYQPQGYGFADVERSLAASRRAGAYVALNLLHFPGVTDREGEVRALARLVRRYHVEQLQTRPLCIDPAAYLAVAESRGGGGRPLGLSLMLAALRREAPWLSIGNFARARFERRA